MAAYEVALGPIVKRFVLSASNDLRKHLADCLRVELQNGPNAGAALPLAIDGVSYTALPLSCGGLVAIFRPLTREELSRLRRERGRKTSKHGFLIVDLLPPGSAVYVRAPFGM